MTHIVSLTATISQYMIPNWRGKRRSMGVLEVHGLLEVHGCPRSPILEVLAISTEVSSFSFRHRRFPTGQIHALLQAIYTAY